MVTGRKAARRRKPRNWRELFLETLAQTSNVTAASRAARVDASTVYKARRHEPDFAARWYEALCEGYDNLEMELLSRLREGDPVGESADDRKKRKYDNATSFRLLSAHRETVEKRRGERSDSPEDDIIASIEAKLTTMRGEETRNRSTATKSVASGTAS